MVKDQVAVTDSVSISLERDCGCDEPAKQPAKTVLGWRCWVVDRVLCSRIDAWADGPDDGVLYKVIYYSDGTRQVQSGMDYYFEEETGLGVTRGTGMDLKDIRTRYPAALVKRGKWVPDEVWYRARQEAVESRW